MNCRKTLLIAGSFICLASLALSSDNVIRDTANYLNPSAEYLQSVLKLSRWSVARKAYLKDPQDKNLRIAGEAELAFNFALTGIELKKKGDNALGDQCIEAALDTFRGVNRIGDDPGSFVDEKHMNGGRIGQVGFVLPEVAMAAQILYQNGYLKGEELNRTNKMLSVVADHWLKYNPQAGMWGMSNWNNRHALGPLRVANFFELQKLSDEAALKKIKDYRRYASAVILRSADYPYGYRRLADGTIAAPVKIGRGQKETPAPANRIPAFGITENSIGYNADSIYNFLNLVSEMPRSEIPQINEKRMKELCEWLKGWQSLVTVNGAVPSYGDADWGAGVTLGAVFEKAAGMFSNKAKYGDAAANFKATALAINEYHQKYCAGVENHGIARVLLVATYKGEAKRATEVSKMIEQNNPDGKKQIAQIILRGNADNNAYAMFQTFHNSSHSHNDIGCLTAYCHNDKVLQHEAGYDAGEIYFHQQAIVRPANEEFIPFAEVFGNPAETIISKGNKNLPFGGWHQLKNASLEDNKEFAYARIDTNYRTSFPDIRRAEFSARRQAVLDKATGAIIVFDTIVNDRNIKRPIAFSPLWHVQNVLKKNDEGFVCEDENQGEFLRVKTKIGIPTGPFWIGMKGEEGSVPAQLTWQFISRGKRHTITPKEHLYLKGKKTLARNEILGVVSVIMPLKSADISVPPAYMKVDKGIAAVTIGKRIYTIDGKGVSLNTK